MTMDMDSQTFLHRGRVRSASYIQELLDFMPPRIDALLDLGCGAGELVLKLSERAAFVVGFDPSPSLLALAQARQHELGRSNVAWVLARAEAMPFRADSFDFVVSVNVLRLTDKVPVLTRLRQVLKPRGRLALKDHLKGREQYGFWVAYFRRLLLVMPSWQRENGWRSMWKMVRYRLTPQGIAQGRQNESMDAAAFLRVCKENLPGCRTETKDFSGTVWWERPVADPE